MDVAFVSESARSLHELCRCIDRGLAAAAAAAAASAGPWRVHCIEFCLQALAAMVKLELPHINLLTKMDLAEDRSAVQEFLIPDPQLLMDR
jgi:hypothetical protein